MNQALKSFRVAFLLALLCLPLAAQTLGLNQPGDPRNIKNGSVIPDEGYYCLSWFLAPAGFEIPARGATAPWRRARGSRQSMA